LETPEQQLSRDLRRLTDRLDSLEATLGTLQGRLEALEQRRSETVALPPAYVPAALPPPPPPASPPTTYTAPRPAPPAPREPVVEVQARVTSAAVTVTQLSTSEPPPPLDRPPLQRPPAPRRELPENWLTEIALKWAAPRVAGVALILAAIFALQWAIQNHRITPAGLVALGVVAGLVLLVFGDLNVRKQRKVMGEALLGAGSALLYISIYAAYAAFNPQVLGYLPAFAGLVMVTALAVALAVRNDAQSTAILAVLGGFLTPKLLQGNGAGEQSISDLVGLFAYVTILDLGLLAASLYRRWRPLQVLCFVATWVLLWTWLGNTSNPELRYATSIPALVLFAIFLLAPVIWNLRLRQPTEPTDLGLILANPACFCPTAAFLVAIFHREYLGAMAVGLAVLYLLLGEVARRRNAADRLLHYSWLSVGLTLITIAVPLQLQGDWIMIAWGMEGALLVWVGFRARSYTVRVLGLALQAVVFGWLMLLYHTAEPLPEGVLPFANTLFMSYLTGTLTIAASLLFYLRGKAPEDDRRQSIGALSVGLIALLVAGGSYELWRLELPVHIHLVWWAVAAALIMAAGHGWRSYTVRVVGHLLNGALVCCMAILYSLRPEPVWLQSAAPVLNEVCLAYLVALLSLAATLVLYQRAHELAPGEEGFARVFAAALGLLVAWAGTSELLRLGLPSHIHLVWWALVSAAIVWCGDRVRNGALFGAGVALQGVLLVWMALLHSLDPAPVWLTWRWPVVNELFLAYLVGMASLGLTLRLLSRRPEAGITGAAQFAPGAMVVMALLAVWSFVADLRWLDAPGHCYVAWWAVASAAIMALGHRRGVAALRVTGLVLQGVLAGWLLLLYSLDPHPLWLTGHQPVANEVFAAFLLGLASLGVTAVLYGQSGLQTLDATVARKALPLALAVLGLWGLTADVSRGLDELSRQFPGLQGIRGFGISLLWCLYAAGLVWYSLIRRRVAVRMVGVVVFALAVFKVFLVDTWQLEAVWKALSYACLAGILLGVSYLYLLHREKLQALFVAEAEPEEPEEAG
jgi:uncharacterized membrane protein